MFGPLIVLLKILWVAVTSPFVVLNLLCMRGDGKSLFDNKKKASAAKRIAWSEPIPLSKMKRVAKRFNATINDVIMACATGALREYMLAHGATPRDLKVIVPVSIRKLRTEDVVLDNRVSAVFLKLPVAVADPILRLTSVKNRMDALKRSSQPFVIYYIVLLLTKLFPLSLCRYIQKSFYSRATLCLTNIPGSRVPQRLAGASVQHMFPWVPLVGNGKVGFACYSYNGHIAYTLLTDPQVVEDPGAITAGCLATFDELCEVCGITFAQEGNVRTAAEDEKLEEHKRRKAAREERRAARAAAGKGGKKSPGKWGSRTMPGRDIGATSDAAANPLDDPAASGSQLYEQMKAMPTERTASERIASTKSIHDSFKQRRKNRARG